MYTSLIPISNFPLNIQRSHSRARISTPSIALISQLRAAELQEPPKNPKAEATNNDFPTMADIISASTAQNLDIELKTLGPFFRITARSLDAQGELGRAEGLIRVWTGGKILHLDSIRLRRETLGMERSIFGIGLFIGAVAIRHGYECGCRRAELLAINDSDLYHSKLVRFYTRIGFKAVHEVTGSILGDIAHMLVWGGVGTRMNANIEDLLIKWCTRFKSQK
ncbi:uncharacterized protein LOC115735871 isoform X1 [Rhodamnia argentea]|uniref:Uncharacterized protein LOC115735871 isoform X1 n=1 Tax=Rhodamnia argentea TaxID=178133 RepID=A0A8B8NLY9_9MYRT|nr:uncharacterized protein LOC115735871 isoform X1 [Rhodamnia argentea]